jgi:hypothetical protein
MSDPDAWLTFVGSVLGGGIAGTAISTYVTATRQGRKARASVRRRLADAENLRWCDEDTKDFRRALTRLEAAALLARVDRRLIQRYSWLATVARYQDALEQASVLGLPPRYLPVQLAALLDHAVETIALAVWHPARWRRRRKRAIWALDRHTAYLQDGFPGWAWNVTLSRPALMPAEEPGIGAAVRRWWTTFIAGTPAFTFKDPPMLPAYAQSSLW